MSANAIADLYRFTDSTGRVRYTNKKEWCQKKYQCSTLPLESGLPQYPKSKLSQYPKMPVTKSQLIVIKKAILNSLKDPYSAHFKWSKNVYIDGEDIGYCAFVNAKNSYGGYTGYTPFSVYLMESTKGWKAVRVNISSEINCPKIDD